MVPEGIFGAIFARCGRETSFNQDSSRDIPTWVAEAQLGLLDAMVPARRYNNVVSDWTQCRTRLTILTSGEAPARTAAETDEVPRRSFVAAATWRVALEVAEADGWKRANEWSFARRSDLDRSLAALGLRQDEVDALYRIGELELRR